MAAGQESNGCGKDGARRWAFGQDSEMKPSQIAVEILGSDAAMTAQETLKPLVAAVDGLDVQFTPDTLTDGLVEAFMADAHSRRTRRIAGAAIGDQQGNRDQEPVAVPLADERPTLLAVRH